MDADMPGDSNQVHLMHFDKKKPQVPEVEEKVASPSTASYPLEKEPEDSEIKNELDNENNGKHKPEEDPTLSKGVIDFPNESSSSSIVPPNLNLSLNHFQETNNGLLVKNPSTDVSPPTTTTTTSSSKQPIVTERKNGHGITPRDSSMNKWQPPESSWDRPPLSSKYNATSGGHAHENENTREPNDHRSITAIESMNSFPSQYHSHNEIGIGIGINIEIEIGTVTVTLKGIGIEIGIGIGIGIVTLHKIGGGHHPREDRLPGYSERYLERSPSSAASSSETATLNSVNLSTGTGMGKEKYNKYGPGAGGAGSSSFVSKFDVPSSSSSSMALSSLPYSKESGHKRNVDASTHFHEGFSSLGEGFGEVAVEEDEEKKKECEREIESESESVEGERYGRFNDAATHL
ncbi:hypothetical protein HMI55_006566, partial [Coelomomyces lativittatus]